MHGHHQRLTLRALLVCLGVSVIVVVSLAQLELFSRSARKVRHTVEAALDELELDEPADSFVGVPHSQSTQPTVHATKMSSSVSDTAGDTHAPAEKVGAGLLLVTRSGWALLLKRRSKHNDATWGLPGGNQEPDDGGDLLTTAKREAIEEMGLLPANCTIKGSVLTRRGKRLQKHYTMFVMEINDEERAAFQPVLDPKEHSEWRWFRIQDLAQLQSALTKGAAGALHTTVGAGMLSSASQPAENAEGQRVSSDVAGIELHPVVELALGPQHSQAIAALMSNTK